MNPQEPNDFSTPPQAPEPQSSPFKNKRVWIIIATILVITIAIIAFILTRDEPKQDTPKTSEPTTVTFSTEEEPVSYAGNKMYDACALMPISYLKQHVGEFENSLKKLGTDNRLADPLMLEHGYVDRSINSEQGDDGAPREPGILISETGSDSTIRAGSFMSIADSHCQYAQGKNFNSNLASLYVIQPPQPLHPALVSYLNTLKANGRMAIESQGVEVYIEELKEGDNSYAAIFRKDNVVALLRTLNFPLIQAASDEIVKNLQAPTGPLVTTFTGAYGQLTDTCKLFSADDFKKALGKPASAVTNEEIGLTELEPRTAVRSCTRIEVERLNQGEISSTNVKLAVSRTEEQAKTNLKDRKSGTETTATPIDDLGDEAFAITESFTKKRSIVIRIKNVLITVTSNGETKDANEADFTKRTQPIAQTVIQKYQR